MRNKHIAAIDLGSNSFHMIIAEIKTPFSFEIVDRRREIVRLGTQKIGSRNFITEAEFQKSIAVLKEFRQLADQYKAAVKAAATSAVRESLNKEIFINEIFNKTAIEIEILSGEKEAELIFSGAAGALDLKAKRALIIDIGGGSTEIITGKGKKITSAVSLQLGAVRLMRYFFPDYIVSPERINSCRNFINEELKKNLLSSKFVYDAAAGTSGTILSVGSTIYFQKNNKFPEKINKVQITNEDLNRFSEMVLSKSTVEQRLSIPGIEEERADILPAGLLILNELFTFFNIDKLILSEYGLREGIIYSYLNSNYVND